MTGLYRNCKIPTGHNSVVEVGAKRGVLYYIRQDGLRLEFRRMDHLRYSLLVGARIKGDIVEAWIANIEGRIPNPKELER